jgi:uncharacterized membrane protein YcgQ (UPF0703/DUF1980 family)
LYFRFNIGCKKENRAMKKILIALFAAFIIWNFTFGNKNTRLLASQNGVLEIKDRLFIAQVSDVYKNSKDYIGTTLKYQGIFGRFIENGEDIKNYYVVRYGPGCCANDVYIGFEVILDGENISDKDYPTENAWVEAIGKVEEYEIEGFKVLRIRLSSLTVLKERGKEFVTL